jgi:transposase
LAQAGLIKGQTIGVDSTTLEANAAMKSIVRRDTRESYTAFLKRLAEADGCGRHGRGWITAHGSQARQKDF